ncbi:MAG: acyl-CoA dehydrogenase [Streptomycetaceae bacterium]|nr:acyl-CoA dehydrogenase [Streptomycetaceae bacterium]NUS58455.1 acyl-CoA dehydrogenase [Streptomycetaceae bacterium]
MDTEEFLLVRDMFRTFAARHRTGTADVDAAARAVAQQALDDLGLDELRRATPPAATAQECALIAEEHGRQPLTTALLGTGLLAPELLRLLGGVSTPGAKPTVAFAGDLRFPASDTPALLAWDCTGADSALFLAADGTVTAFALGPEAPGADLLRTVRTVSTDDAPTVLGRLGTADAQRWQAFALVVVTAELVGAAASFVSQAVDYARDRHQYGRPIGSFQAVQHLLADATVLVEACTSATRYAAWCLDHETPEAALTAARVAKAEANASAAEAVYGGMQAFGGIAQTWEHTAHLYLRRVLAGAAVLATTADLLTCLAAPETAR